MTLPFRKKTITNDATQYTLFWFLLVVLIQVSAVNAGVHLKMIKLSSLGAFETQFSKIEKVNKMKGQNLIGDVSYMPGKNFSVRLPFDTQQVNYLVTNGSQVKQGQKVAMVEGYDVHHFIESYNSSKALLEIQAHHFQRNKLYFEKKTIRSSQWLEIAENYYEAKLKFEHLQHQMSFLHIAQNEQVSLISPINGVIQIPTPASSKLSGELSFDVINKDALKVQISMPLMLASSISHFEVNPTCNLEVNYIENIADRFHQRLWASPTSTHCQLTLGQSITVTPIRHINGFKVAKSAIFEYENKDYIALKVNDALSLVPIHLLGTNEANYIFTTKEHIESKHALISSVSILQGSLLNLGTD